MATCEITLSLEAQVESFRSSHEDQEQTWLDHDLQMLQGKRALCTSDFDRLASEVDNSKQSTQKRSSTQNASSSSSNESSRPIRASAMLQSFQFSGLDPSLMANLQSLIAGSNSIDVLRQQYEDANQRRQDELVIHADIDAAEKHLTDFLKELEKYSIFSEELDTMKTAAFQCLGDLETITRILPTSFGGTRVGLPEIEGTNMQIKDIIATDKRHKFDRAVSLCFAAKDWERGISGVQDMLQRDSTRLDDMKSSDDPHICAFHVVETNRQQLADIKDRRDILSTVSSGEFFIGMARIAFKFSEVPDSSCGPSQQWTLTPAEWEDQGLRFLELRRSRTLLDLLIVRKLAPPDLKVWSKYSYQLRLKEKKSSTKDTTETKSQDRIDKEPESREKYLERIYGELTEELESPSLSKLLPEPAAVRESNEKFYQCIPETAIVLHISSSREGLIILCITSQGIIDIHTAEIMALQLDRHIFRFAKLFRDVKYPGSSSLPAIATCNQHIQAISDEIIEPVSRHIETKEHVIFIPSPSLNKFPLSALIYKMEPLFMSKDVSQVPSLSVLQHLVEKKHRLSKKVSVIYKDPESTHGGALDISASAAIKIAGSFHAKPQAATKAFTEDMFIEVYCTSILDLARLHSNATLVIFEAHVSGLGEESIGNDLLGFSHAVLASGAIAFLGRLWKAKLIDEKLAAQLRQTVEDFIEDMQELGANFAHPFYWAPFVLMGHSGLVLDFDEFVETGSEVLAL
ncbi:hypothetical protein BKA61DRAFT_579760 [Leptodontidium sp. MPI-SDFR-AT-0119]|nr:hypothetical protein BKA61DRAFT_579760 [Leptodontidium sp. MPI-SDFR-AT-0119]